MNFLPAFETRISELATRERLDVWSRAWDKKRTVTILDVGTGSPALPLRILQWARQRRFHLKITELGADAAFEAAAEEEPSLEVERASLNEVADSGRKFHYVMGSLCLRRVPPERLEDTLRLCDKIALKGLVFSDLRKSAAYPGRGAFTSEELEIAADRAGLRYLRARRCALFGMSLAGEKY
jgi:hypothetical protein